MDALLPHGRRPRTPAYLVCIEHLEWCNISPATLNSMATSAISLTCLTHSELRLALKGYGRIRGLFPGTSHGGVLCGLERRCSPSWPRTPLPACPATCVHPCAYPPRTSQSFSRHLLLQQSPDGYPRDGFVQRGSPHASLPALSPIQYQQERRLQTAKEHQEIYVYMYGHMHVDLWMAVGST